MNILNKAKLGLLGTTVALGLTLTAGAASADPSVTGAFINGANQFSDNSGEFAFDPTTGPGGDDFGGWRCRDRRRADQFVSI